MEVTNCKGFYFNVYFVFCTHTNAFLVVILTVFCRGLNWCLRLFFLRPCCALVRLVVCLALVLELASRSL